MKRRNLPVQVFFGCVAACLCLSFGSCKKKPDSQEAVIQIQDHAADHWWYYITSRGLTQCDLPQNAVLQLLRPWTENLRVSDAVTDRNGTGIVLVNRLGVLVFDADKGRDPLILQDVQLFSSTTAEHIVFDGKNPYITLYKSSFFNKDASVVYGGAKPDASRPYLVRISVANRMLYPVVTYGDLGVLDGGEVTSSYFDGSKWFLSVKTTNAEKTDFRYISWKPSASLEKLPPFTKEGKINYEYVTEDMYRATSMVQPLSNAPERLRRLLSSISADFPYEVTFRNAGTAGDYVYANTAAEDAASHAYSIMADGWICTIFADGTSYFSGALDGYPLLADGAKIAFRLPKLPKSYYYTNFCISGHQLIVGWEERDFYKTARSGVLIVDMAAVFYPDSEGAK
ncbi:MAG: hypothetical protein K6G80_08770 [Treponema sp.]|nr:hypothetical protein [Treponema sp.]